jgi:hypothetical protein
MLTVQDLLTYVIDSDEAGIKTPIVVKQQDGTIVSIAGPESLELSEQGELVLVAE